jgi:hypothetical protein
MGYPRRRHLTLRDRGAFNRRQKRRALIGDVFGWRRCCLELLNVAVDVCGCLWVSVGGRRGIRSSVRIVLPILIRQTQ